MLGVVLRAAAAQSAPPKSTVVVSQSADFTTLDPALAQTPDAWELEYATCARLLNYPPRSGYRGTRLVPEVASALPTVSPDRLIYTFHIRPGWQFSDGTSVTAASFARTFERARSPELVSPADTYLREVRSWRGLWADVDDQAEHARAGLRPAACAAVLLRRPEQGAERAARQPSVGRPVRDRRAITAAVRCCCDRNPYYHGPRKTHVDAIVYRFGAFPSEIRLQLEDGEADYGVVTPAAFAELAATKFKRDKTHLFVVQQPIVAYLALNTQRPLFQEQPASCGERSTTRSTGRCSPTCSGGTARKPNDEYIPPGFPGYEADHVYPDRRARTWRPRGVWRRATCAAATRRSSRAGRRRASTARWPCRRRSGKIGLKVDVKTSPGTSQLTLAAVRGTKFDITDVITRPDYGDPYALIDKLLDSRAIRSVGNTNLAYFASPP